MTLKEHEEATKVKNISRIAIGRYEMNTWYFSPFPKEYTNCETLYWCAPHIWAWVLLWHARRERWGALRLRRTVPVAVTLACYVCGDVC